MVRSASGPVPVGHVPAFRYASLGRQNGRVRTRPGADRGGEPRPGITRPRRAELLAALSLAIDLGLGMPMEHMLRSSVIATRLADRLGLREDQRATVFYCSLVAWIGLLVVLQNIFTSLFNSHLFDFHEGWMYVLGVGVAGGMVLKTGSREAGLVPGNSGRS